MEWISINEKLPKEKDGRVLAFYPNNAGEEITTAIYSEYSGTWYIGDMCGVSKESPTHWMPLPESPKISKELNCMEWISVKKIKPECEEEVLVRVKHEYPNGKLYYITTTAIYEDGKMNTDDSIWYWDNDVDFDYDEENDEYLIPEGWWEYRHYNPDDVYNNMIDGEVTHWMKLPNLQEGDQNEHMD